MKKYILLFFALGSLSLFAQDNSVEMITNRPGFTEASRGVWKGGFQIETGFQYEGDEALSPTYRKYSIPNIGFLYGVAERVELRVFGTLLSEKKPKSPTETTESLSLSGLTVGAKFSIMEEDGWKPELAILATLGIPANGEKAWPTGVLLAWSYSLPKNFSLSGNLSYGYTFGEQVIHNQYGYTVNLGYEIKNNFGTYAEIYGFDNLGRNGYFDANITAGFWYRFTSKFQVDLLGGFSVDGNPNYLYNVGFSWLIMK